MHMPPRLLHRLMLCLATSVLIAACGPSAPTPPAIPASATPASGSAASAGPADTTQPSTSTSSAAAASPAGSTTTTQTNTDWGRIWDALPAGFPHYPGATVADDAGAAPASGRFAVQGGDAKTIASWFQSQLEGASFRTQALQGPLEDGSYVLDSVGSGTCRLQVAVAPTGGLTLITLRYGAACPNS